ncbi:MAG: hypothetical protein JXA08_09635 [Methanomicrobiaceae archaeon]|nr:hypothetical protein [Methanomicrobiaceae archaeon]
MGVKFTVYFENEPLSQRVKPLLPDIPAYFELDRGEEECDFECPWPDDPNWCDFPFPKTPGKVYVFSGEGKEARCLGGHFFGRVAVMVKDHDDGETITLRIWHELLHAVDMPADDMNTAPSEWIPSLFMRFVFRVTGAIFRNYWERRYYLYLTQKLE